VPGVKISRRVFLRLALLGSIGASLAYYQRLTQPLGAVTFTRWMLRGRYQQSLGKKAIVALGECPSYQADLFKNLSSLWELAEMPDVRGLNVLVKPNLVDTAEEHPSTTAPEVVAALVDLLIDQGASQVTVGDGPAFRRDASSIAQATGLDEMLRQRNVPFVDLNYADPQPVPVKDDWISRADVLWLPRHVLEADLIVSVPKMKTHHWANVSLSLKNLLGIIPGLRYGWPKNTIHFNGITATILGLYQILPPVCAVVDGIVGMEGDGPLFGTPVQHGLLAVGKEAVSVDTACAGLMGFDLHEVEYLSMAAWAGVGQATRIETRGIEPKILQRQYIRPPKI
jgi:uncharacterized protein (DUF362 family)